MGSCLRNYHLVRLCGFLPPKATTPPPSPRQAVLTCALLPLLTSFPRVAGLFHHLPALQTAVGSSGGPHLQRASPARGARGDFFISSRLRACQKFSFHFFLGTSLFSSLNPRWSRIASSGFEALERSPWAETLPTSLQEFTVLLWPPKPGASNPNYRKHHLCQLLISPKRPQTLKQPC